MNNEQACPAQTGNVEYRNVKLHHSLFPVRYLISIKYSCLLAMNIFTNYPNAQFITWRSQNQIDFQL
ncbi:MAG: hypothetical protein Q8N83_09395 [Ignavibacteria bacterium]|nr:hypothetical protein [Ignavibacteria bacterium]